MPPTRKIANTPGKAGERAVKLLNEKVLDVLERLLEATDDKVQLAAAKEIKEIASNMDVPPDEASGGQRVFVVTGIGRKPGEQ